MKVLIVGAGIAGLAMARALEMNGIANVVVERQKSSPVTGKSIFLLGNAMRAMSDLGLADEILQIAYPVASQTIMSSTGRILNKVSTREFWDGCGPCVSLLRKDLLATLQNSLRISETRFGATVTRTMVRDGKREVMFSDGHTEEFDLVIGADGVNSSLRAKVFKTVSPIGLGLTASRLVTDLSHGLEGWTAMLTRGRSLLAIPLGPDRLYLYADSPTSDFRGGTVAELKNLFSEFGSPLGRVIDAIPPETSIHTDELREVPAGKYLAERLVLIGDAAHATSPSMAQGAGLALEDAVVLARRLKGEPQLGVALELFHLDREKRVSWVRKQCHLRDRMRTSSDLISHLLLSTVGSVLYRRAYRPLLPPL